MTADLLADDDGEVFDQFAILCLARCLASQRSSTGSVITVLPGRLAPHPSLGGRLLNRVRALEPLDRAAGFSELRSDPHETTGPDTDTARFRIYSSARLQTLADAIELNLGELFSGDKGSIEGAAIWQELIAAEASEFLELCLLEQGFDPRWEIEVREELLSLASYFSAGELYNLCWVGVREGASQYVKCHGNSMMTIVAIRSSIRRRASYAADGEYPLKPYNRHHYSVPSIAARVLSEGVTSLGTSYLRSKPWSDAILQHARGTPTAREAFALPEPLTPA